MDNKGLIVQCPALRESDLDAEIGRINEKLRKLEPGTSEYRALLQDRKICLDTKEQVKKIRWLGLSKDKLIIGGVSIAVMTIISAVGLALSQDDPRAMPIVKFAHSIFKPPVL